MSAVNHPEKTEVKGRGRSMTGFPYVDLENGIETIKGVVANGRASCTFQQLSDSVKNELSSNAFRIRVNTTWRQYGLIVVNKDLITPTDLGYAILEPKTEHEARVNAFFRVPLYKDLFVKFSNQVLPAPKEIERVMEELGVAPLQKARARQIFMRSAKQAGLLDHSDTGLSIPGSVELEVTTPSRESTSEKSDDVSKNIPVQSYDPAIDGLLKRLPKPETEWPYVERAKWLRALAVALDLIYTVPAEDESASIEVIRKAHY